LVFGHCRLRPQPRHDENAAEEWRAYPTFDDGLPVFCPECAEREFSEN
jgi:hypothetical protein